MTEPNDVERMRILSLVEDEKITAEEGDRLVASMETQHQTVRCPYCAEEIVIGLDQCPKCSSALQPVPLKHGMEPHSAETGWHGLSGGGRFLVLYTFIVTAIVILSGFGTFPSLSAICRTSLALLGLSSAILLCKGNPTGWMLGATWGALQLPLVIVDHTALNKQILSADVSWMVNGAGFGINLVGLVLLILFLNARGNSSIGHYRPGRAQHNQRGTSSWR